MKRRTRPALLFLLGTVGCNSDLSFQSVEGRMSKVSAAGGNAGAGGDGPASWELSFAEECNGQALGDQVLTLMRVGDATFRSWGSRADWMADEQVTVGNGLCTITAVPEPNGDRQFTSGVLNTAGRFEQEFGRFEARLKFPAGTGLWPQWWLRSVHGWPPAIHVAGLSGHRPNELSQEVWYLTEQGPTEREGVLQGSWVNEFHVYRADWSATEIQFFVDDEPVGRLDLQGIAPLGPLYPIVNLSVHDGTAGPPPDTTTPWPAILELDFLRVYRRVR